MLAVFSMDLLKAKYSLVFRLLKLKFIKEIFLLKTAGKFKKKQGKNFEKSERIFEIKQK